MLDPTRGTAPSGVARCVFEEDNRGRMPQGDGDLVYAELKIRMATALCTLRSSGYGETLTDRCESGLTVSNRPDYPPK
jgi:hypothetical protein